MKRNITTQLVNWQQSDRRKPLILQGARQTGKTHAITEFSTSHYKSLAYINFEEMSGSDMLFAQGIEPKILLEKLENYLDMKILPEETLLFLDEIQACPEALNSLKYFNEKANEYHIIAAGSLLGVKLNNTKGFPVGKVNFLHMYPMTFFEFLDAIGKSRLREMLDKIEKIEPISEPFHSQLLELLKKYLYLGGMPEVIASYRDNNDLNETREIQHEILRSYELDFSKHVASSNDTLKISSVWHSLPTQLGKENKKFIYTALRKSARGREYEIAIQWLVDADLICKINQISTPFLPLKAYSNSDIFKTYALDVGILGALCEVKPQVILEKFKLFEMFHGALIENFVAQELTAAYQQQLYYWSEGKAKVDFVMDYEGIIYPFEAKSGLSKFKRSLISYDNKYNPDFITRGSPRNLKIDGKFVNYPLYLSCLFPRLNHLAIHRT